MRENTAEAQSGEASGFRKCARDYQIVVAADPGNNCDSRKLEIGFVHNHHVFLWRLSGCAAIPRVESRLPVGLFGLARKKTRGGLRSAARSCLHRKLHGCVVARCLDSGAGKLGIEAIHRVGWLDEQDDVVGLEKVYPRSGVALRRCHWSAAVRRCARRKIGASSRRTVSCSGYMEIAAELRFANRRARFRRASEGFSLKSRRSFPSRPSSGG